MIKLEVEEYCHECPRFEADVENPMVIYNPFGEEAFVGDTFIRCINREKCKTLFKYANKRSGDVTGNPQINQIQINEE